MGSACLRCVVSFGQAADRCKESRQMSADAILLRRAILDWRDQCLFDAEITLTRLFRDIAPLVSEELGKATLWSLTAQPAEACEAVVNPLLKLRLDPALHGLQDRASSSLRHLRQEPFAVHMVQRKAAAGREVLATSSIWARQVLRWPLVCGDCLRPQV